MRQPPEPPEPFVLPPELNIYSVLETRDALLSWIATQTAAGHDSLDITAANVQEIDGAGLQLLAALGNMNHPWRLLNRSAPFDSACQTLGLAQWLPTGPQASATHSAAQP